MFAPSFRRVPFAPVESALSEPAKSTKLILDTFSVVKSVIRSCLCCVKNIVNTACDRELVSFIFVAATVLENKFENGRIEIGYNQDKKINPYLALLPSSINSWISS